MTTSLCPTMQTVILQRDEIPVRRPHLGHDRPRFLSWLQVRAARHPMPSLLPLPTWWSVSSSRTPDDYFTMITASHSFTCCRHVTWRELTHSPRPSDFCGRPAPAKYGHRRLSAEDGAYYRGRRLLSQKYHYRINSFAANPMAHLAQHRLAGRAGTSGIRPERRGGMGRLPWQCWSQACSTRLQAPFGYGRRIPYDDP